MDALQKAYKRSNDMCSTARVQSVQMKQAGILGSFDSSFGSVGGNSFNAFRNQSANRERYSLFRGWAYSAINALCLRASRQPVRVGRLLGVSPKGEMSTSHLTKNMPAGIQMKALREGFDLVRDHPLVDALDRPNTFQDRASFVYNFVANINLTGWGFILGGQAEDGTNLEFFSIPTTWVPPIHTKGPFAEFKIQDPKKPQANNADNIFPRENVGFGYMPNPADPLSALPPLAAQMDAVRIDDHIQTGQERFFENGVFPSVVVSIGRDPHPDVPGGVRPRLTAGQYRQIKGAIQKKMGGVANMGAPAIVDGMIESILPLGYSSNEMGWAESEEKVKTRILSAFAVHPFLLAEPMNVGGYSQAAVIQGVFCDRVNTFLDMLSMIMTNFAVPLAEDTNKLAIWWDTCEPDDPALRAKQLEIGRKNNDITRNEWRANNGFPAIDAEVERSRLMDHPAGLTGIIQIYTSLGNGLIDNDQAAALIAVFLDIPIEEAKEMVGEGIPQTNEIIEVLQATVEEMKKPVKVEVDDENLSKTISDITSLVTKTRIQMEKDNREVKSMKQKIDELDEAQAFAIIEKEMTKRELAELMNHSIEVSSKDVQIAISEIKAVIASKFTGELKDGIIQQTLDTLSERLTKSNDKIEKALEQPINISVTNEVNPTPVDITNEVSPAEVNVTNNMPPTQVDVHNKVETPEVEVNVEKTVVNVDAPIVNVEAPDVIVQNPPIKIEPKIEVQPAEVKVEICKNEPPKQATITHADGTQSQVRLSD